MLSHVFVGTNDFDAALAFYEAILPGLGWTRRFVERDRPWAGWEGPMAAERPFFLVGAPSDGEPATSGNGAMVAFLATSRADVDAFHAAAVAAGGRCEGPPGLRPEYHEQFYGAYVRDLDGNKLCACCHEAE